MSDVEHLRKIAFTLIENGFNVRSSAGVLTVSSGDETVSLVPDHVDPLPPAFVEEIYWANFYERSNIGEGSSFYVAVSERPDLPRHVIDLGCGDGRDSFAFARDRRTVVGIDRSHVGIEHASEHARDLGLADVISFRQCDVGDAGQLGELLSDALPASDPVLFYARFFLHSIAEDVQQTLLATIAAVARPGDQFAAEFRTLADQARQKVYGGHYRRYQDGAEFGRRLAADFGFTVLDEREGSGLAPYGDEDPIVYRVIARR